MKNTHIVPAFLLNFVIVDTIQNRGSERGHGSDANSRKTGFIFFIGGIGIVGAVFQTVQKMNGVKTGKAGFQWAVGDAFMNNIASITDTEKFPAGVDLPCFRPRSAKKALSLINQQMGTLALNHLINHRF